MFSPLGIRADQIYGDVYTSWLRDTFEKNNNDTKQLFRDVVEAGFLGLQVVLRRQRLGIHVITSLATALHRSPLTKLDLHGNALRDVGCEVVAHLMPDLPNLTYLDLGANGITGAGARSLGLAVAQHAKLAVLILSSRRTEDTYANDMTATAPGTAVLLHGCLRSRSLRQLDLSGNPLGGDAGDAAAATASAGPTRDSAGGATHSANAEGKNRATTDLLEGLGGTMNAGGEAESDGRGSSNEERQSPVDLLCQVLTRPTGSLTVLRLGDVGLTACNACRLVAALKANTTLTLLDLSENQLPRVVGDAIGELLQERVAAQNSCALSTLCLSGNPIFAEGGGGSSSSSSGGSEATAAGGVLGKKLLSAIAANGSTMGQPFAASASASSAAEHPPPSLLLASLANDRVLTTLELNRCGVDTSAIRCLCRSLVTNTALLSLSLRHNAIDTDAAVDLGRALCHHPALQKLYLAGNAIGDEGACALAAVVEGDQGQLYTTGAGGGGGSSNDQAAGRFDEDGTAVAGGGTGGAGAAGRSVCFSPETLRSRKGQGGGGGMGGSRRQSAVVDKGPASTLEVLDLQHTWLGDRGLIALGVALQGNASLRTLRLGGNHFTSQGGEAFAALLEGNHSLISCDLGATSVPCPTVLRLERCVARNRSKLEQAESDALRREVVRLHFQKYKLEEAKNALEGLRDRSATTKATAENYDLQFKQDQSDYAKKVRELEEQRESYAAQEQRYSQQVQQLEADLRKAEATFEEDMLVAKERLDAETRHREEVEQTFREVEAELAEWKTNAQGRESAKRDALTAMKEEMNNWAAQRKQYRQDADQLTQELKGLEAKAAALNAGDAKKSKKKNPPTAAAKAKA